MTLIERIFRGKAADKPAAEVAVMAATDELEGLYQRVMRYEKTPPPANEAVQMVNDFNRQVRAFAAAQYDEFNADLAGTYGSPNTEIFPNLYSARSRTRTLAKDTPQGKAVVRTFENYVIGDKYFEMEMQFGEYDDTDNFTEDKKVNRVVEKHWKNFLKRANFTVGGTSAAFECGRMIEAEMVTAGNLICRLFRDYPNNPYGFAVEFYEADRLQETFQGKADNGNPIRASIEYDIKYPTRPVAYHILTKHPAEFTVMTGNGKVYRERVPAEDIILYSNLRERAEQDIGMTELDAAVQTIWRNQQFVKALTLVAIASHIRAFVLEKDLPNGLNLPDSLREQFINSQEYLNGQTGGIPTGSNGPDPIQDQQRNGMPTQAYKPGMERTLPPGVKAKVVGSEFPTVASVGFRQDNGNDVALATGVSSQHATANYQNLGFMAALMCQEPFQRFCRIRQKNHVDGRLDRIFREWLISSIKKGIFDDEGVPLKMSKLDDYCECAHFKGAGFPFINPLVQAQAIILLCEAGHITRQQAQDMLPNGMAFEKLLRNLKKEKDELQANGLNYGDVDATRPQMSKGEPGQTVAAPGAPEAATGGQADIPPKTKTPNPLNRGLQRLGLSIQELISSSMNGEH